MLFGDDVINLEWIERVFLGELAVFADSVCPVPNELTQSAIHDRASPGLEYGSRFEFQQLNQTAAAAKLFKFSFLRFRQQALPCLFRQLVHPPFVALMKFQLKNETGYIGREAIHMAIDCPAEDFRLTCFDRGKVHATIIPRWTMRQPARFFFSFGRPRQ